MTLRLRMTLWFVALLAVVIAAVGIFLVVSLRTDLLDGVDAALGPATAQVAGDYSREGLLEFTDSAKTVLKGDRAAAQLVGADGRLVRTFGDALATRPMLSAAQLARVRAGHGIITTRTLSGRAFRVAGRPALRHGRREAVVAAQSLASVLHAVGRVTTLLAIALPAALLAVALGGWWLAGRSLRPIARITGTAEAIGADRLDDRVCEPRSGDEVARLARTFNTMLDRIQRAVGEQRRLVGDASHELRTPLTAMRAEIDVSLRADDLGPAARAVLLSAREEVERMSRTVADLLTLAAADEGAYAVALEPADLATVSAGVVDALRPLARESDVSLAHQARATPVLADAQELGRAVRNLVENAIRFTPPGGTVRITAAGGTVGVHDEGPGVPEALRDRIFDRFFRIDSARGRATGGSGLGLAIVRQIAEAHGGRVRVLPRAPHGSSFVIELAPAGGHATAPVQALGVTGTPVPT